MIPSKEMRILRRFIDAARRLFGERMVSVAAYGSILTDAYTAGVSDVNLVLVVEAMRAGDLLAFRRSLSAFARRNRIRPVFFTPSFIASSADVFPIEWREIAERRKVLHGKDCFAAVSVSPADLRLQFERELKQDYLRFRQALALGPSPEEALRESARTLEVLLRNAVAALGTPVEKPPHLAEARRTGRIAREKLKGVLDDHLAFLENLLQLSEKRS